MKKTIVITGAGSGLGKSFAQKYAALGCHICLIGRNVKKLEAVAKTLRSTYSLHAVDVSVKEEVSAVFQEIKQNVGNIDVLINNAGVGVFDLAEKIDEISVHQMIDVNLKGTIFTTQEVLPDMKHRSSGIIANIVSTAGIEGKVNESVYCASKFGVRGFTESLHEEVDGTGVKVYAAYMGGMKTNFWDDVFEEEEMTHLMDPDDVADIIMDNLKPRQGLEVSEIVIRNKR
ncbi:MAG TPA: SDR family NAD(P)-dependent oxidoreductase [Cerasibacillus sp.]|uniref:SDR family oxidoreductase n=1 Tax=Cerasibacillus sp. TaxID=2498711 RepID=UPI002F40D122